VKKDEKVDSFNYIEELKILFERCALCSGKSVFLFIIANPTAGGFTIPRRVRENRHFLDSAVESVRSKPVLTKSCSAELFLTESAGHAGKLADDVLKRIEMIDDRDSLDFLITAGGDGTSLEVQTTLANYFLEKQPEKATGNICLLRLPLGTGNDGSDGRTLDKTLSLLTGKSRFDKQRAVRVFPSGKENEPWFAFNIASIGLDAFVTHMTNRVKNLFPGNFYKIWVDIACVFYNRMYHVGNMKVTATLKNNTPVFSHTEQMVLYVMGESGFRTYGSNQKILPDDRNICGIREMPLTRKLFLKKFIKNGNHINFPEVILYSAERLVIEYNEKILVQLDGETHLLGNPDFPLTMELTEPLIPVLKAVP
jgi:diacylglycerol kinase family enzyme